MSTYRRDFDKTKYDSEAVYNEKDLKAKIKSYDGKINRNFHNNKIPKEGFQCVSLSVVLIDSVIDYLTDIIFK